MSIPLPDFWRLLVESRLASAEQARQLRAMFSHVKGGDEAHVNAIALAQWMTSNGLLSLYQAKVLLAGRAGPFVFGDYLLYDRFEAGRFKGAFRAVYLPSRDRVLLVFHTGPMAQIARQWSIVVQQTTRFCQAVNPHLSRVQNLFDLGQYKFTVLENLEGHSAEQRLANGPIPWREACQIAEQVAQGLSCLAELRLVHGDIRPANIWLDSHGTAKLLLPLLAHDPSVISGPIDFTQPDPTGRMLALAENVAPELAQPGVRPDMRTDIYALGCTLYHMIAGRPPFTGDDISAKLMQHTSAEPSAPLESLGAPPWVAQVVSYMMEKNLTSRYQHPHQVAAALAASIEPTNSAAPIPAPHAVAAATVTLPDMLPMQSMAPLDMSGTGVHAAALPENQALEFPPVDLAANENSGVFDAIVLAPARNRRAPQSSGLYMVTAILALCVLAGAIYLVASHMPKQDASTAGKVPASDVSRPASVEKAKPSDKSESGSTSSNDDEHSKQRESETGAGPVAISVALADAAKPPRASDNTKALWASPTSGEPLSVDYAAPGAQAFLFLRPEVLLRGGDGEKLLAALGPAGESEKQDLEAIAGMPLAEIEQLTVAWVERMSTDNESTVVPMYIFRFGKPVDQATLLALWNNPSPVSKNGEKIYTTPHGAVYLPDKQGGKVLVAGAPEEIEQSAEQGDSPPPLRREIEKLLLTSDADREVTFLFVPSYLFQNKQFFFEGPLEKLRTPLQVFLGSDCRSALLSANLSKENFFIEFCALGPLDSPPEKLAEKYRQRAAKLPEAVAGCLAAIHPQPYDQQLLSRYPAMIRVADEFTRAGTRNDQVVLRCYLPTVAAHNLVMGSELALAEAASAAPQANTASNGPKQPETVPQKLQHVTSLVFARETLERALQLLGDDIGVKIEIKGSDLQLEGITKNQSFGLDEKNQPAGEILRKIMLKANPDGKLVYVVKSDPGGGELLWITTRAAVKKRGDKLPPELTTVKGKAN